MAPRSRTSPKRSRRSRKRSQTKRRKPRRKLAFGLPTGTVPYFTTNVPFQNPPQWWIPYTNNQAQIIPSAKIQ